MSLEFRSEKNTYLVIHGTAIIGTITFCYGAWHYEMDVDWCSYLYSFEELDIISSKLKELNS